MKKRVILIGLVLALILSIAIPFSIASAATSGTVNCTVTASYVSLTVTDGTVSYGAVAPGATKDTTATGDTQTVTNTGTIPVNFYIRSSNATRTGGTDWTLAATAGANEFTHKFKGGLATDWTDIPADGSEINTQLASQLAAGNSVQFDLQIGMPTAVTDPAQHNITVTIIAN